MNNEQNSLHPLDIYFDPLVGDFHFHMPCICKPEGIHGAGGSLLEAQNTFLFDRVNHTCCETKE